ncbi:MAG TPA: hypothetical protein DHN29_11275 [Cytophagales bacterium]|jgi:hypothetical protein|nr:DUF1838 family protein [Candidatus Neomarinimicrobiota bacterium]HCX22489.1 hypothetical protein [Cytophagales bacterium]|tara:strand:- start:819 stop:1691 length:873 start_codon:yes stop_codon:yes gene_type:complete
MQTTKTMMAFFSLLLFFLTQNINAFELTPGTGYLKASRKITCSLIDDQPIVYWWYGRAYSRVPGEKDRLLFRVEGMNIRQCTTLEDEERGLGFRMVSRELLFYQDPETGKNLDTWDNPWTGETVEVLHVANDPVNWGNQYEMDKNGEPYQMNLSIHGDYWWDTSTIPLFYKNPLGGDYQDYIGGIYHATEMFNTTGNVSDLTDDTKHTAEARIGWERMSDWLPWMKMSGRSGIIYFHTFGRKLESYDQLPESFQEEIDNNYPKYNSPPPTDDQRRNETSWTYFKKTLESQ